MRYRVIHGYRRAYRMVGSGPALLLVHGISDHSGTWEHLLPELAKRYTVVAPDLLGHGGSDKPRADYAAAAYACGMRDLLGVLDIDRVTVVGHSLGGGVAMQFAYQFPERCSRLVLVASGGVGRGVHPLLRLASTPGAGLALPFLTHLPGVASLLPMLDFGPDADYARERYTALRDRATRTAFLRTLRSVVDVRGQVVTMLDRCYLTRGIPTLLVWGSADRIVPVGHAHEAHEAMPDSRLEIFPGAGHSRTRPTRTASSPCSTTSSTRPPPPNTTRTTGARCSATAPTRSRSRRVPRRADPPARSRTAATRPRCSAPGPAPRPRRPDRAARGSRRR